MIIHFFEFRVLSEGDKTKFETGSNLRIEDQQIKRNNFRCRVSERG